MRLSVLLVLITGLWAALFLPGLGDTELKGEEGRRILPAREMLRRENYVLPFSEGRPYHRKPPGINWAIASMFKITGVQNEWTARLPSVLGLLALALTGAWAGFRIGGGAMGLALGIALQVNGGMLEKARLVEIEALYVSLAGIGILAWAALWRTERGAWTVWLSTVIPFALANLVKGPVYLVFFYPIVILAQRRIGQGRALWHPAHFVSLVLALAPMIVWGFLVKQQLADSPPQILFDDEGHEILAKTPGEVWWQQISGRLSFAKINVKDWLELPFRVLLLLAPWPVLAWWLGGKNLSPPSARGPALRWALGWGLLGSIGLFCLLPATRARYLMPALGPVCLWAVLVLMENRPRHRLWQHFLLALFVLNSVVVLVAPWFLLAHALPAVLWNALVTAAVWAAWTRWRGPAQPLRSFTDMVWPLLVLTCGLVTTVLPKAHGQENVRPTAAAILALATQPGSIVAINPGPQPFLFYLGPRCTELVKISDLPDDTAYLLVQPKLWQGEAETKSKLMARGFTQVLTTVKDVRFDDGSGREYLLIGRAPKP